MDFDKIFSDFDAAREVHDIETISNTIKRVIEHCTALAQSGRANEIPPVANEIAAHVNIMIYFVMKLLSDGDASKAKRYFGEPNTVELGFDD